MLAMGLLCLTAAAIPADPTPFQVQQPDGTTLTLQLRGDEFFHYTTTHDGYTVLDNGKGHYTYARLDGQQLISSGVLAHDAAQRTAADYRAINALSKRLVSPLQAQQGRQKLSRRNSVMRRVGSDGRMDYDHFRGLIILVNYSDKKFSMTDPSAFYDDMVNTHDFTGYTHNGRRVPMTGSVRDYFYDNSNHMFDPAFDVVGPITIPYSCRYPHETDNASIIFNAALKAVDPDIDFNDYDLDGDGFVDMVFFLVAGYSANYGGNNRGYLWPHMHYLYSSPALDNVNFGLYACSTEIAGWEYSTDHDINGIGTICHEFGHVLGLPDLYDTDYEQGGGGQSNDPGHWSIMANGSGEDYGRDPVGYGLYERYALGFAQPIVLPEEDIHIELEPLDVSNQGYRLNTPNSDEFFLIENRQPGKWDYALPGYGMLVARVDSTNAAVWDNNQVNTRPSHMYYELLRANDLGADSPSDPFPGASGVTSITNDTHPNLLTWDGAINDFNITHIAQHGKIVSFDLEHDTTFQYLIEDFEAMPATSDQFAAGVKGVYSDWDFTKCAIHNPGDDLCNGTSAVAMKRPSQITTAAPLQAKPFMVRYTVFNPTTSEAKFQLYYSTDEGANWTSATSMQLVVPGKSKASSSVRVPTDAPIKLRIVQFAGSTKNDCFLDDIKIYYQESWPVHHVADVNLDGEINVADVNAIISMILDDSLLQRSGDVNRDGEVNIADVNYLIVLILNLDS